MDDRTGSEWEPAAGRAICGPLEGEDLDTVPGVVSDRDARTTFYPQSALWSASGQAPETQGAGSSSPMNGGNER